MWVRESFIGWVRMVCHDWDGSWRCLLIGSVDTGSYADCILVAVSGCGSIMVVVTVTEYWLLWWLIFVVVS